MGAKIRQLLQGSFFRFLLVGVLNTAVGTGVWLVLYNVVGLHRYGNAGYWLATIGNYTVGSVVSFFLNRRFTFRSTQRGSRVILRFILNIALCMFLAYGIAQRLVAYLLLGSTLSTQLQGNLAMLMGMGLFVVLNYFGQRFFAFRRE